MPLLLTPIESRELHHLRVSLFTVVELSSFMWVLSRLFHCFFNRLLLIFLALESCAPSRFIPWRLFRCSDIIAVPPLRRYVFGQYLHLHSAFPARLKYSYSRSRFGMWS